MGTINITTSLSFQMTENYSVEVSTVMIGMTECWAYYLFDKVTMQREYCGYRIKDKCHGLDKTFVSWIYKRFLKRFEEKL